jgi:hypothetical protein
MIARTRPVHASSDKRMAHAHAMRRSVAVLNDRRNNIAAAPPLVIDRRLECSSHFKCSPVRRLDCPGFALDGLEDGGDEPARHGHENEEPCHRDAGGESDDQLRKGTARLGRARVVGDFCLRGGRSGGGVDEKQSVLGGATSSPRTRGPNQGCEGSSSSGAIGASIAPDCRRRPAFLCR